MEFLMSVLAAFTLWNIAAIVGFLTLGCIITLVVSALVSTWFDWMLESRISHLNRSVDHLMLAQINYPRTDDVKKIVQSYIDRSNNDLKERVADLRSTQLNIILDLERVKTGEYKVIPRTKKSK